MGQKALRKSKKYKQLIKMVAQTSGYHEYEVADVLNHLVGNVQVLLAEGTDVKISGLGTMKVKRMHVTKLPNHPDRVVNYVSYRLSVCSDSKMQEYLKDNYESPETLDLSE
ncbi:MAG: HU family DNA-binding protein [Gammaproteobacteria bacterium]